MTKKERALRAVDALKQLYPDALCSLDAQNPLELLIAPRLSAQCTDARVNLVTPVLFAKYRTLDDYCEAKLSDVEEIIHSCGFYHSKARYLKEMSQDLLDRFDGQVPDSIERLRTLAGVGRKTANVVYAVAFGGQAIAVDTHVFRVSNRLGIADAKNVLDTEKQLMQTIPQYMWADSHHYLLLHGRYVCKAQRPLCNRCSVRDLCKTYAENNHE